MGGMRVGGGGDWEHVPPPPPPPPALLARIVLHQLEVTTIVHRASCNQHHCLNYPAPRMRSEGVK